MDSAKGSDTSNNVNVVIDDDDFFEVMSSLWYACATMKINVVLLAGSRITQGHWTGTNSRCVVKLMLMVDELLGMQS